MNPVLPSPRALNGLTFLGCVAAMAGALYLQYQVGLEPCPLCIFQRVGVIAVALVVLIAFLHGPKRIGVRIYAALAALAALAGGGVAVRQLWLQHLPPDQVPVCGPGLDYMLDVFPLHEVLAKVLSGSGECAEVTWRFLGLSLAGWSLILFIVLLIVALVQLTRSLRD